METEYPKNRTDLILLQTINEDCKKLLALKDKYRGLEEVEDFNHHIDVAVQILQNISVR